MHPERSSGHAEKHERSAGSVNIDHDEHDRSLKTVAETSGFRKTGRSDEVARLCAAYAQASQAT